MIRMTLLDAINLAIAECHKAEAKHGRLPVNLTRSFMIMSEEYGEWGKEVVKLDRKPCPEADASLDNLLKEQVQAAAVALRAIENTLNRRAGNEGPDIYA